MLATNMWKAEQTEMQEDHMDTQNEDSIVLLPFKHNKPPSVDRYIDPGRVFVSEKFFESTG